MVSGEHHDIRISVRNLWKVFGQNPDAVLNQEWVKLASKSEIQERTTHVVAIKDLKFDVRVGEVFVIMGLSGSGKSTLVRCLMRLIEPTRGSIEIDGENVLNYSEQQLIRLRREKMGMIFQHYGLLPHKRVRDNVAYGLEVQGVPKAARSVKAVEALEKVGLAGWEEAYPDELSGGMQQRVGFARALALDPEILLMDEPFSSLDPLLRREMQEELIKLQARVQKTIVLVTHSLSEAFKLGERIAIMRDGEIVQIGTAEEIVTHPADDYVREFVQDVSRSRVVTANEIMREPDAVVYERHGPEAAINIMQAKSVDYAFVVGSDYRLRGRLLLGTAAGAMQRGLTTLKDENIPQVREVKIDTRIEELMTQVSYHEWPIAVVDDQRRLLGEIRREDLLVSIGPDSSRDEGDAGSFEA